MTNLASLATDLATILPVRVTEPLAAHTTFGIGGPADLFVTVARREEMLRVWGWAQGHHLPALVWGGGSNLLVGDGGFRGLVIENRLARGGNKAQDGRLVLRTEAGVSLPRLARRTAWAGWEGLEWAGGIPGTLGGAVVYNAGAFGGNLAQVLQRVEVLYPNGDTAWIPAHRLGLGYRESLFSRQKEGESSPAILTVELALVAGDSEEIRHRWQLLAQERRRTQPRGRSAGSVFKNPKEHPAGWLIEQAGLKGRRQGGAQIAEKHANFIINRGGARAADVLALVELAQEEVQRRFGITLEREIQLVGEFAK